MDQPSQKLADRYGLVLDEGWEAWFDAAGQLQLPGAFQHVARLDDLLAPAPASVWPGFMLPDSLPIVGNGYGDWLCIRVDHQNRINEVVHWYHGGGDWIPVGESIEQAILHDVVDQFRPLQPQMLRGAGETLDVDHLEQVRIDSSRPEFQAWLRSGLSRTPTGDASVVPILDALFSDDYRTALSILHACGWSLPATVCDLVESELQSAVTRDLIATAGERYGVNARAIARCLFDPEQYTAPNSSSRELEGWQPANWPAIQGWCQQIATMRQDLAWVSDLLGWCYQRQGEVQGATQAYSKGCFASAFTNQAVRLRTHWFNQSFGKFSIAQYCELGGTSSQPADGQAYLALYPGETMELLQRVTAYWERLAEEQTAAGEFDKAYESWMRAGWDLGAPSLADYGRILTGLVNAANNAGWTARALIATAHLQRWSKRR